MDEGGIAKAAADRAVDDALESHCRRVDTIRATHGRRHCEECGELIPERRRLAVPGCRLCVGCQQALETMTKRDCNGD